MRRTAVATAGGSPRRDYTHEHHITIEDSRRRGDDDDSLKGPRKNHNIVLIFLLTALSMAFLALGLSTKISIPGVISDKVADPAIENRKAEVRQIADALMVASEHGTLHQELERIAKRLETKTKVTQVDSMITDSSTATVIAMASGYGLREYRRFVGSLRMTGYKGHVILGMSPDMKKGVRDYLEMQNVTIKPLQYTNCTYKLHENAKIEGNSHSKEMRTCANPYSNIKLRWSRFPLARDWLEECKDCTGPVLVTDFRDAFFQRDPFLGTFITGLQVFEEHYSIKTTNWLAEWPIRECKGVTYNEPMLCSGTTVGTRAAMIKYFEAMYAEMLVWMADPKCNFGINGDDQSIHNYLYYSGKLPFATAIPNRMGIVHTAGAQGSIIAKEHVKHLMSTLNMTEDEANATPYQGADGKNVWLGKAFDLTDEEGYFINFDGTRSRVVHQYDRFRRSLHFGWFARQEGKVWS